VVSNALSLSTECSILDTFFSFFRIYIRFCFSSSASPSTVWTCLSFPPGAVRPLADERPPCLAAWRPLTSRSNSYLPPDQQSSSALRLQYNLSLHSDIFVAAFLRLVHCSNCSSALRTNLRETFKFLFKIWCFAAPMKCQLLLRNFACKCLLTQHVCCLAVSLNQVENR